MKKDFIEYIKNEFGFDDTEVEKFEDSLNTPLKKSIRINTTKISIDDFKKRAFKNNWILTATNLGKNTFYIDREDSKEVALGNTVEHIAGYFYVQEVAASSSPFFMSEDKIDENPYLILDMSASPGGKTTQLSEYYPKSLIVANELDKSRLKGFFSNLDRMSNLKTVATNYDGRFFKNTPEIFDKILLDAPCSGEGTAFKTDEALRYWNLKNIKVISKLQYGLLESAMKALKVGGELVYSTCTLNKFENEGVIEKAIKKYGDFIEVAPLSKDADFKRNWPHIEFTGGFFIAKIVKTKSFNIKEEVKEIESNNKWDNKKEDIRFVRQNIEKISNTDENKILDFFKQNFDFDLSDYYLYIYMGEIHLTSESVNELWNKIFLYKIGIKIGDFKSGEFIPGFYAGTFSRFTKNTLEVNKVELDRLLKGFEPDTELLDGYYQVIFDDIEVGLVKAKNGKIKSLIPTKLMRN